MVPEDFLAMPLQCRSQGVQIGHGKGGMSLALRGEILLHAEMQHRPTSPEPAAAPARQRRGLFFFPHAEQIAEKRPGFVFATGRHGQLDVIEPGNHAR